MVGSLGQCAGFKNWAQHSQARSENGYGKWHVLEDRNWVNWVTYTHCE